MTEKTFTSMKQFREHYFPNMVKEELASPCPFPHKTPKKILDGMQSCPNLRAFAEAQKDGNDNEYKNTQRSA